MLDRNVNKVAPHARVCRSRLQYPLAVAALLVSLTGCGPTATNTAQPQAARQSSSATAQSTSPTATPTPSASSAVPANAYRGNDVTAAFCAKYANYNQAFHDSSIQEMIYAITDELPYAPKVEQVTLVEHRAYLESAGASASKLNLNLTTKQRNEAISFGLFDNVNYATCISHQAVQTPLQMQQILIQKGYLTQ